MLTSKSEKLKVRVEGNTAVVTIDNPPANTWDEDNLAALEALLAAHNADQVEPLWRSVIDMPQRIDKHGEEPFDASDEYVYWPN